MRGRGDSAGPPTDLRWRDVRPRLETRADRATIAGTIGGLFALGGILLFSSLLLPAPPDRDDAGLAAVGAGAILVAGAVIALRNWFAAWSLRLIPLLGTGLVGAAVYFGSARGTAAYAFLFLWVMAAAALFFELELILVHGMIAVVVYAVVLELDGSQASIGLQVIAAGGSVLAMTLVMSGITIQLRRRMSQLEVLARTDPLTGVLNRRALADAFRREISRAQRREEGALGLVVVDLDHFKVYNDLHGHPAGDLILRRLCDVLTRSSRSEDYVVRLGGEEFAVLAPDTNLPGTLVMAERLRHAVELEFSSPDERLTVSLGVAAMPVNGLTGSDLMAAADQALYEAKELGRNRAVASGWVAPPETERTP